MSEEARCGDITCNVCDYKISEDKNLIAFFRYDRNIMSEEPCSRYMSSCVCGYVSVILTDIP